MEPPGQPLPQWKLLGVDLPYNMPGTEEGTGKALLFFRLRH